MTTFAAVLAVAWGSGLGGSVLVTVAVLLGQLSIGWSNDRIDADRDVAGGRGAKPLVRGFVGRATLSRAAGAALGTCVVVSLANGWLPGAVHLACVGSGWVYNLGLKRTLASFLPYALAFGLLPSFVTLGLLAPRWAAAWVTVAAALLGVGAHVANALPDIPDDLVAGVRGLPQRLGPRGARLLAPVPLVAASVLVTFAPAGPPPPLAWAGLGLSAVLLAVVAYGAHRPGARWRRLPFPAALTIAAIDVAVLVAGTAPYRP